MSSDQCAQGGYIAEHVFLALFGVVVLAQLPYALKSLAWLASGRHSCGVNPRAPPSGSWTLRARCFQSASSGLWLHYRSWRAAAPSKGTVYIVHGYAEHCGRYEAVAQGLAAAGYDCVAFDQQGHGGSEGDRGYVERLSFSVEDVIQLAEAVAPPQVPGSPRFLLGHSMGALVAIHAAARAPQLWSGLVLSGPALKVDPKVDNALNRFLAVSLSNLLPKLEVQPIDPRAVSSCPDQVAAYVRDPLNWHGCIRVRTGYEMMQGIKAAFELAATGGLDAVPLLIVHGGDDSLATPAGSSALVAALATHKAARLEVYPGLRHELLFEPEAAQGGGGATVLADIVAWLNKRVE